MKTTRVRSSFDRAYYKRFYETSATACITGDDVDRLACFVVRYLEYLHIPSRRVLDVGCGIGLWKKGLRKAGAKVDYTGIEVSDYLCDKYGWGRASIVDFKPRRKFDLVICQGVLPYLSNKDARAAIDNMARICRGALYLEAVTREDNEARTYDIKRTDRRVHLRTGRWYRRYLSPHFASAGGGVFIAKRSQTVLFELEKG